MERKRSNKDEEEVELAFTKVDHENFFKIFGIKGGKENKNFQTWRKVATIFELNPIPKSVELIKLGIEDTIRDMDWPDIEELRKVHFAKGQKKRKLEKTDTNRIEATGLEDRMGTLENMMRTLISRFPNTSVTVDDDVQPSIPQEDPVEHTRQHIESPSEGKMLHFTQEDPPFSLSTEVTDYILPKGSLFTNLKSSSHKDRKDIIEKYPPPLEIPSRAPDSEPNWQNIINSGAKAREKELHTIAQQLLEMCFPITHIIDFLESSFPEGSEEWGIAFRDFFLLFSHLQNYVTTLRKENIIRATGGPNAVSVMKKRKESEPLMGDETETALKAWSKTQETMKKFKLQPLPQRGGSRGRGRFLQSNYSRPPRPFRFNKPPQRRGRV